MPDGFSHYAYRFSIMALILLTNAFFAGAEVALVSVRRSRLQSLADQGNKGAQAALTLLASPERLLSVVPVGVTLASLALGWAGEEAIYGVLVSWLQPVATPANEWILRSASLAMAFVVMTFAHVIFGEVIPKNLALERSEHLATLVAPPLLLFARVSAPLVAVIEQSAARFSRLLGLRGETHAGGHSPEELKFIVSLSREQGHLRSFEGDAIQRLIDLPNYYAREIMVPRHAVVSVPLDAPLERMLRTMLEHQFSRYPVHQDSPERIVGIVHVKDLLRIWESRRYANARRRSPIPFRLEPLLRKPLVVPETKPIHQLLHEFRQGHVHMALVVDEFGTVTGIVTFEDVLEQVFGEIEDEHDEKRLPPALEAAELELDGTTSIRDLDTQYGLSLPGDAGFETLAGFVLFQLGRIPQPGERVEHDGLRFTVVEMDRNRIARVKVERDTEPAT